ncbi:hypothetical protein, partial [Mesorhizobium sp. M0323]|uniref:hypothetical protein n=1 Tax=Mesorhizobium sp. M0323 TaxID=2956938 RepID=UPI0033363C3B
MSAMKVALSASIRSRTLSCRTTEIDGEGLAGWILLKKSGAPQIATDLRIQFHPGALHGIRIQFWGLYETPSYESATGDRDADFFEQYRYGGNRKFDANPRESSPAVHSCSTGSVLGQAGQ